MDPLSRLLTLNAPEGAIDKNCMLSGEWYLPHTAGDLSVIRWHTVTEGTALLEMSSGERATLRPGIVLILPQNSAHRLSHQGDENTHIVCGSLRLPTSARHFLTALPELLPLETDRDSPESAWLSASIALLQHEAQRGRPGTDALCSQQCATMIALALRRWLEHAAQGKSLLTLLIHPRLGSVMLAMLASPAFSWTVERLAQRAHMSRASFAQLFRDVSGGTPVAVLTSLRLQMAAQALSREAAPVIAIAESVGYASESSFHKAFVREFGCTPGDYRRRVKALAE